MPTPTHNSIVQEKKSCFFLPLSIPYGRRHEDVKVHEVFLCHSHIVCTSLFGENSLLTMADL